MRSSSVKAAVVLALMALTFLVNVFGFGALDILPVTEMRFGIDIRGGISAVIYPGESLDGSEVTVADLMAAKAKLDKRLEGKGIYDKNVYVDGANGRILLEIPHKPGETDKDPQRTLDEIGRTALLTFQEVDEDDYRLDPITGERLYNPTGIVVLNGSNVREAQAQLNMSTNRMVVGLELDAEGTARFAEATARLIGKPIAIFMDDEFISAPIVNSAINEGRAQIEMGRSNSSAANREAQNLASTIRAGSLPFNLEVRQVSSISPLLGEGALKVTVMAGLVAFAVIFAFMLIAYRLPGFIAMATLALLIGLDLLVMCALHLSMTLPGIAGVILTIGMGIDANIIIFCRIKEEFGEGRSLKASIDMGFKNAFASILDSN
ncbi:MAG: MMPL family transporter, partial [Oscillospiraceae bacterium]|nr:MMPL family transporter [Oscillospiraceae bacterium]